MLISELNQRSRSILRSVIDAYLETGEPVGSRTIAKQLSMALSPATIRNVMADLEEGGLLFSPHTSAGRLPTEAGLRLFVDGLLELGNLTEEERRSIKQSCAGSGQSLEGLLEEATSALSGLSRCAGLVVAPKTQAPLRHIELVSLNPGRALVILVNENGLVENRVVELPPETPPSSLVKASNYLSARLAGRTLSETHDEIVAELEAHRAELDELTSRVVASGLATWSGDTQQRALIIRGQANLLDDIHAIGDLEHIRGLFDLLETKTATLNMLRMVDSADGVQIFIGSDNTLFNLSGCSMVVGPYRDTQDRIIGAIGVIGPTRINYARIIPMVDYTAKIIGRLIG